MFGAAFSGIDVLGKGYVRSSTLAWAGAGIVLSFIAATLGRRVRAGAVPVLTGAALGALYLGVSWLMAKAGA